MMAQFDSCEGDAVIYDVALLIINGVQSSDVKYLA